MPSINFFEEDVQFKLKQKKNTSEWIKLAVSQEGKELGDINFIFCSDTYLHKINVEYLNHDTLTDIITFDNSENDEVIEGDIFISIDRVQENSAQFNRPHDEELHRVIIHGVLHLAGYDDKTAASKREMTKKEDAYLSLR
jgi:probable rRNA maturation factor